MKFPFSKTDAQVVLEHSIPTPFCGCWLWTGPLTPTGYGRAIRRYSAYVRTSIQAHRLSYKAFIGEPGGMDVCHTCDTPLCVNPAHLFLGTAKDNVADMIKKGRQQDYLKRCMPGSRYLTREQILSARTDPRSHTTIAAELGVSRTVISNIKSGKRWATIQ